MNIPFTLADPALDADFLAIITVLICSMGFQKGVERITKIMMAFLFIILIVLCVRSLSLDGAREGIKFYLIPDFGKMLEHGPGETIFAAMGQSFFTLSLGIGSMAIFGSYIDKNRSRQSDASIEM